MEIKKDLRRIGTPERAEVSRWFFKTGPGQYGEGDIFIGITVPDMRSVAKMHRGTSLPEALRLLRSKEHEFRLTALLILVDMFSCGSGKERKGVYEAYLKNTRWVNNWDLVDVSAPNIVGEYLREHGKAKETLLALARSKYLWERRIAMVATFAFIKRGESALALCVATTLLSDEHDLMHKAVGWMLREVGKRCGEDVLMRYLEEHKKNMPRTALRYAIERFTPAKRKALMKK